MKEDGKGLSFSLSLFVLLLQDQRTVMLQWARTLTNHHVFVSSMGVCRLYLEYKLFEDKTLPLSVRSGEIWNRISEAHIGLNGFN